MVRAGVVGGGLAPRSAEPADHGTNPVSVQQRSPPRSTASLCSRAGPKAEAGRPMDGGALAPQGLQSEDGGLEAWARWVRSGLRLPLAAWLLGTSWVFGPQNSWVAWGGLGHGVLPCELQRLAGWAAGSLLTLLWAARLCCVVPALQQRAMLFPPCSVLVFARRGAPEVGSVVYFDASDGLCYVRRVEAVFTESSAAGPIVSVKTVGDMPGAPDDRPLYSEDGTASSLALRHVRGTLVAGPYPLASVFVAGAVCLMVKEKELHIHHWSKGAGGFRDIVSDGPLLFPRYPPAHHGGVLGLPSAPLLRARVQPPGLDSRSTGGDWSRQMPRLATRWPRLRRRRRLSGRRRSWWRRESEWRAPAQARPGDGVERLEIAAPFLPHPLPLAVLFSDLHWIPLDAVKTLKY
ncbi:unnamed protein product [Prorocentrum cordatum]|uniref:Mitochondrial inner membrane protease subunit n=1 Tax=Prorocentrum cordatum TaxID=2364126 RepID=A0ABN9U0A5_9DINO|nr:unnamed protein product [Polarella glacialis]CAK0852067.1 unnamed protein product [Polarella glacialis]